MRLGQRDGAKRDGKRAETKWGKPKGNYPKVGGASQKRAKPKWAEPKMNFSILRNWAIWVAWCVAQCCLVPLGRCLVQIDYPPSIEALLELTKNCSNCIKIHARPLTCLQCRRKQFIFCIFLLHSIVDLNSWSDSFDLCIWIKAEKVTRSILSRSVYCWLDLVWLLARFSAINQWNDRPMSCLNLS